MFSARRRPSATWCPCGTNLSLRDVSMSSSLQGSTTIAGRRKFHMKGGLNFETHLRPPLPFFFDFLFLSLLISHGSPFRPGVWRSQDDYLFLYCALEAYITNNGTTIPRWGCHLFWHKYISDIKHIWCHIHENFHWKTSHQVHRHQAHENHQTHLHSPVDLEQWRNGYQLNGCVRVRIPIIITRDKARWSYHKEMGKTNLLLLGEQGLHWQRWRTSQQGRQHQNY